MSFMTRKRLLASVAVVAAFFNLATLVFLAGTNRLTTNDEARGIEAGVLAWVVGDFGTACDVPPLSRLVAAAPLAA
ncbi:hypothetical protein ACYOEI_38535, partial [Singulisphaera rosea]